jgi:hypothetical protein
MKTLVIERPTKLQNFTHEIRWTLGDLDLRTAPKAALLATTHIANRVGGGATAVGNYCLATQLLEGVVLIVDERVSRDLEISSIAGSLANLSWPAPSIEMRFQDPGLPSILLCPDVGRGTEEAAVAFCATDKDGACLSLALPERLWQDYIKGDVEPHMAHRVEEDIDLEAGEAAAMRYLATLAIKVIAYSSVPQHKPVRIETRAEMKEAGLHPKHVVVPTHPTYISPKRKAFVVRYLPRVIRPHIERGNGAKHRTFMGRAGHIRYFTSDYWKNVKGQWRMIAPIPPPEGVNIVYKVRSISV